MKLYFNTLLEQAGIDPADVRLLRHHKVYQGGRTPYSLWRDDRPEFERYQSSQPVGRKAYFNSPYWASFVVPPDGSTLFAGLYKISGYEPVAADWVDPLARQTSAQIGKDLNIYRFERLSEFEPLAARLKVEWGGGARQWVQHTAPTVSGVAGNPMLQPDMEAMPHSEAGTPRITRSASSKWPALRPRRRRSSSWKTCGSRSCRAAKWGLTATKRKPVPDQVVIRHSGG